MRSRATVDAILAATARVLAKVGFERTSTNAIARVAGVSIGSLYQYFPSKEALVAILLERHVSTLIALAHSAFRELGEEPVPLATRRLVDALFALSSQDPKLYAVFVDQLPAVGRLKRIRDLEAELVRLAQAYLERHRNELCVSDLPLAAYLLVHTLQALTHDVIRDQPERLGDPALREEVSALCARYLTGA